MFLVTVFSAALICARYLQRILKFGDGLDWAMIGICTVTALGAGIAMPLMFLVFGRLVGNFTEYFVPFSKMSKAEFMSIVNKNASVKPPVNFDSQLQDTDRC
jgi:hypothetical protein